MTATNAPIKKIALHAMRSAVSIFEFRSQFALTSVLRVDGMRQSLAGDSGCGAKFKARHAGANSHGARDV